MKNKYALLLLLWLTPVTGVLAAGGHDPILTMVKVDRLETALQDGPDPYLLDGKLWVGRDLYKLWLRADARHFDGRLDALRLDLMYGMGITPFWDLLMGWSRRLEPAPDKDWLALSLQGLAPQLLETDINLYADENGVVNLQAELEYEYLFSQRLVLSPELALSVWNKDNAGERIYAGVEAAEVAIRLHYMPWREFAPYIGVERELHFGDKAQAIRAGGGDIGVTRYLLGVRMWF